MKNIFYPGLNRFYMAGRDRYFLYCFNTKETLFITKKEAEKLAKFYSAVTLDEYAESFSASNHETNDFFSFIIDKKLARQFNLIFERETPATTALSCNNEKSFTIAVITHNRPELLKTSVESIAISLNKNNYNIPVTVFDDSADIKIADQNSKVINKTAKDLYSNISCFGKKEKDLFLDTILQKVKGSGIDKKLVDFAFYSSKEFETAKGPGGNRNISLLKSAGKKLISFDDDIEIIPKTGKKKTGLPVISFDKNPEVNLFDNIKKAVKILPHYNIDPIDSLLNMTGISAAELLKISKQCGGKIDSKEFTGEAGYNIEKTGGKIIAAMSGIYGGRWFSRTGKIYTNNGAYRTSSYRKKSAYYKIKKNPVAALLSPSIRVSDIPFLVTSACAIDASEGIMPPFPPAGRNEDSIWALLALYINKNSFIAYTPAAVYHNENNKKEFNKKNYTDISADLGLINFLIIDSVKAKESWLKLPASLPYIGKQLQELSTLSDIEWLDLCNTIWMKYTGRFIEELENILDFYRKKPKFWALDVTEHIGLLKEQILIPEDSLPAEFRINNNIKDACRLHKLFFNYYGKLLEAWPQIWEAACSLQKEKV